MRWLFLVLLVGCATVHTKEKMLEDGKTWEVVHLDSGLCRGSTEDAACESRMRPFIVKHGTVLCGAAPERVFACKKQRWRNDIGYQCLVKCP